MIGGSIVVGEHSDEVLFRAIGPNLTNFGVAQCFARSMIKLHDGNGALLASNDNWRDTQEAEIIATDIAPTRTTLQRHSPKLFRRAHNRYSARERTIQRA